MTDCTCHGFRRILPLGLSGVGAAMRIVAANREYERWLARQLGSELVKADIKTKHKKMRGSAFAFLRATYWRWAETILDVCPDLAATPSVLAVGDTHLENFGTWRDDDGRLVWGVNDYDECTEMPYMLDVVRLATSAALAASPAQLSLRAICANILGGYRQGIDAPIAFVLDQRHLWLRERFVVDEAARATFWQKVDDQYRAHTANKRPERPRVKWLKLFVDALPEPSVKLVYWRHTAGTGSLGRPRWLGYGTWRSGPLLREAKALVPSGWTRVHGGGKQSHLNAIAGGCYRAPDPWYAANGDVLIRRLSANNRKINVANRRDAVQLLSPDLLWDMGRDLAAVHLGTRDRRDAIRKDLATRKQRWFRGCVAAAAEFVAGEYTEWSKSAK